MTPRRLLCALVLLVSATHAVADELGLREQLARATYRLEHPKTSGTAFVVARPDPTDEEQTELLLVTAAHAFEAMEGTTATLGLRTQYPTGEWSARPLELEIRRNGQPLWRRHPDLDVAVLPLPGSIDAASIPVNALASAPDWANVSPAPGDLVRCVGFPHAAQFRPSEAGFPLVRLGCIASYPLTPFQQHPTFLVDYNTFEGDSGGPVYVETDTGESSRIEIIGLVQGQHFINEEYELVYQEGQIRKRLGLAIVVNSQAILETVAMLPTNEP